MPLRSFAPGAKAMPAKGKIVTFFSVFVKWHIKKEPGGSFLFFMTIVLLIRKDFPLDNGLSFV